MVTALALESAGNADEHALQALERLQEAATFVRAMTDKQMQLMKYDEKSLAPSIYHGNPKVPDNG